MLTCDGKFLFFIFIYFLNFSSVLPTQQIMASPPNSPVGDLEVSVLTSQLRLVPSALAGALREGGYSTSCATAPPNQ